MHGRYALVIITGKLQRGSGRSRGAPRAYQLPEGATVLAEHPPLSNTVGDACQARARLVLSVVSVNPVLALRVVGQPVLLG